MPVTVPCAMCLAVPCALCLWSCWLPVSHTLPNFSGGRAGGLPLAALLGVPSPSHRAAPAHSDGLAVHQTAGPAHLDTLRPVTSAADQSQELLTHEQLTSHKSC